MMTSWRRLRFFGLVWMQIWFTGGALFGQPAFAATVADDVVCAGCVDGSDIANGTIGPDKLIPGSINATTIANASIGANKLVPGSITATVIANGVIGPNKLIPGSINATVIANGSIGTNKLIPGSINATVIAAGSINESKILDSAVTTAKIADTAVSTAKIANGAVTGNKIASGAVTYDKLAPDTLYSYPLLATYSGLMSVVQWECTDPNLNGVGASHLALTISSLTGNDFTGTVTATYTEPGLTQTISGPFSGTVYPFGRLSATATTETRVNGVLYGTSTVRIMGALTQMDQLVSMELTGAATSGETCIFLGHGLAEAN